MEIRNVEKMKNKLANLVLACAIILTLISSSHCYATNGGYAPIVDVPIEIRIEISPNPAYLGEDVNVSVGIFSDKLVDKKVNFFTCAYIPDRIPFQLPKTVEGKIPINCTYTFQNERLLKYTNGYSAELTIQVQADVEGYPNITKVHHEALHIYNYSKPSKMLTPTPSVKPTPAPRAIFAIGGLLVVAYILRRKK